MKNETWSIFGKEIRKRNSFIIAEVGVNHNGSLELATKLVDEAKNCKSDAVKFQTYKTENLVAPSAPMAQYQKENLAENGNQYDFLKKLELKFEDFAYLKEYCENKEIGFLSSPFDLESALFLNNIGTEVFKIPSGEIMNSFLLRKIASFSKPIILSTGMSTLADIEYGINQLVGPNPPKIILLHCITSYPSSIEEYNISAMRTLKKAFGFPVGVSDHSPGSIIPILSVAMGGVMIEKHFTLDKKLEGPDHKASLNPDEFRKMVNDVRLAERALGDGIKLPTEEELKIAKVARKSIVALTNIEVDEEFSEKNIAFKRPGTGINPRYIDVIINSKAKINIKKDTVITWDMILT